MTESADAVESIFLAALERATAGERLAFVEAACAGDPDVRARVRRLLRCHDQPHGPLDEPPPGVAAGPPDRCEGPGTVIGPYKLAEQIGEGGMGLVFLAEQAQPVRRLVALKVLKPGLDTRHVLARFDAERQALALMDHPHIAQIFDAGTTPAGRPYFVMELVKGVPVTDFCDQHRLDPRRRLELFADVCRAVQHAHQKGVIHRDLKPSNILVTLHDTVAVPKVIDFGIAKATGERLTEQTLVTQFWQVVGTPLYMSPEQAEMNGLDVDTRSDVYALGVLLYELLTGATPFDRDRLRSAGPDEVRRILREEEPPAPSRQVGVMTGAARSTVSERRGVDARRYAGLLRGDLDWIVMKALEKDRNRRYESASALAADVEHYLAGEAVQACPPSAWYRFRKFARRNRGAVVTAAALAALLALGTTGTAVGLVWALQAERAASDAASAALVQRDRALAAEALAAQRLADVTTEKNRVAAAEVEAQDEAAIARAVNDFLTNDLLAAASPENNARDKKVTVEELLGRAAGRIAGKFENQPRTEAAIRLTIGQTYRKLGDYAAAQTHLERAVELRRRSSGEDHGNTLNAMGSLAGLYRERGHYAKAEPLALKVLEVRRRTQGEDHDKTLVAKNNLAMLYLDWGRPAKAEPLFAAVLDHRRRVLGGDHPDTLNTVNNLAVLRNSLGRPAEAEALFAEAVAGRRRALGGEHPDTLNSANGLAVLLQARGQYAEAESLYAQVVAASRRILGSDHPSTLLSVSNLGMLYCERGRYAEAEPLLIGALADRRRVLGEDHPDTLIALDYLAALHQFRGQFDEAEPLFAAALAARRRILGDAHRSTVNSMNNLARLDLARGRHAEAEGRLRAVLGGLESGDGSNVPQRANALSLLGRCLLLQRKYADAEPVLRRCVAERERHTPDAWGTFDARAMLGGALLGQKKYAEAEPLLTTGYEGLREREARTRAADRGRLTDALERLVELADATGQAERSAAWRKELDARTAAAANPAPPAPK